MQKVKLSKKNGFWEKAESFDESLQRQFVENSYLLLTGILRIHLLEGRRPVSNWDRFVWRSEEGSRRERLKKGTLGWESERSKAEQAIYDLYFEGRLKRILQMDFAEFRLRTLGAKTFWPGEYRYRFYRYGLGNYDCPYRDGPSYRKSYDHLPKDKKNLDEEAQRRAEAKAAWREEKGLKRDKSRAGGGSFRHGNARKSFFKAVSAKSHRRWVQKTLANGKWDQFHDKEYQTFANPRDWD